MLVWGCFCLREQHVLMRGLIVAFGGVCASAGLVE
ncbi:hypothetical protein P305_05465 [Xylella fastidiosa subsp. fastidiosa Mus-1]|nr:hypothetical protein P305_05465 [Xylella fastidiosa subsp. fastidiosa Mus-1]